MSNEPVPVPKLFRFPWYNSQVPVVQPSISIWSSAFGVVGTAGFVGSSMVFSTIFTASGDSANPSQINLMCWSFACFTSAFAAGASMQVVLTMVSPTHPDGTKLPYFQAFLSIVMYIGSAFLFAGVLLPGVAVSMKVKGAGIVSLILPAFFVVLAVVSIFVLNRIPEDASEE